MSFLDKLHRNENAIDVRPEAELKKLFGRGKRKDREREQQNEQQDQGAADRLANAALNGNPIEAAARAIVGGADPIAPFVANVTSVSSDSEEKQEAASNRLQQAAERNTENRNASMEVVDKSNDDASEPAGKERKKKGGLLGKLEKIGDALKPEIHANVGGFDIHVEAKPKLEDKKLGLGINVDVDGKLGNTDIHAEASTENAAAKKPKIDAKAEADTTTKNGTTLHAEVSGEDLGSKDRKVDAKAEVDATTKNGTALHADVSGTDLTGKERNVDAKASASKNGLGAEVTVEDIGGESKVDGKIGKLDEAASPAERMAKVALDNAEGPAKEDSKDAKAGAAVDTKGKASDGDVTAPAAGGKNAKGIAAPTAHAAGPALAADKVEAPIVSKPNTKLGPGGKSVTALAAKTPKNAVGRYGENLEALDIGPDPEAPIAMDVPGAPVDDGGADPIEIGLAGPTLPKLAPKGPRKKITAKKGQGDWNAKQSKGVQSATQSVEARKNEATSHGEGLAHGSGTMAKAHVDQDAQTAGSLTAVANRPPSLVQKRGGRKPIKQAKAKQPAPTTEAKEKQPQPAEAKEKKTPHQLADKNAKRKQGGKGEEQNEAESVEEQLDNVVDMAKAAVPDAIKPVAEAFSKGLDAGGLGGDTIKKLVDPKTRALAAVSGVPADQKSGVLGRLDAVNAVGGEQAKRFVDHIQQKTLGIADERAGEAEQVGKGKGKGDPMGLDGAASVLNPGLEVAGSYLQHHARDHKSLDRIAQQAFADLAISPEQERLQQKPDLRDPEVREAIADGRDPSQPRERTMMAYVAEPVGPQQGMPADMLMQQQPQQQPAQPQQPPGQQQPGQPQQQPGQRPQATAPQQVSDEPQAQPQQAPNQARNPQQVAANAQQQAQGVQRGQNARNAQHTQHARNREQEAATRATARKKQAADDKKRREEALEKSAPEQKAKMKAELTAHKDLAVQVLSMNKEELAAEYERRLSEDTKALQAEIKKAEEDVTKTWKDQEPKAIAANAKAKVDINKFCDNEKTEIDGQLATLSRQLKTNPEQAAKTAEEQGKDDCDRYADTRDGNIERIKDSAQEAAAEQRRLGDEAYRVHAARAERQTDEAAKQKAMGDAQAQKEHFYGQAQKAITDGDGKAATEKKKYDDLIATRTESYKTTARNIREKGVGYLDELKTSFEQAKKDIETLRAASIKQADEQLALDQKHINDEIANEMKRLALQLEDRERELRTEIKYALESMANLTDEQKAKMRADVEKAHQEACQRIDEAKANELNAMQMQLADCHSRIDQSLGALGPHTVKAVRQLSSYRQEFSERVTGTVESINARAEGAVRAQEQIAQTAATTAGKIRNNAMDSVAGMNEEQLGKRDQWSDFNAQKEAFEKQKAADEKRQTDRLAEMKRIGNANHALQTEAKVSTARSEMMTAIGGYGVNPDMSKVMQQMATLSPEELQQLFQGPEGEALRKRLDELSKPGWIMGPTIAPSDIERLNQMTNAKTPEDVKAQVVDWCFNGGFTGAGYDDTTFKEVMKGMSTEDRAEVNRMFRQKTGKSIDEEIDDEAWFSGQNNRLMKAHATSEGAVIAEEKWQAAEGGFFRGVKDVVDSVPGGRFLTDPGGEIMRGVGPMFGLKVPDHPLDTLAGYGMNQDAYIKQTDRLRELTEPPPGASAAEVSAYLQKRREIMREIDGHLGSNHNGLTLEALDNSEANSDYNRFWMKNNDATTFRNMLDAGRTGDWAQYSNNKAAYGAETTLGNRNWLKEEIEYRQGRGDLKGLREFLGSRSEDGSFESFVDANMPQAVDRGYFKSIAKDPPPAKGSPEWREQIANRLLYAQFGGRTGWGDDRAEMEKIIRSMSKEELDAIRGEYTKLSGQYGLTMDNDANKIQMVTNPIGFFFLGNWSAGDLDKDMYLSYGGYMADASGGLIGKGRDYAALEYDLKNGKPQTPAEAKARAQFLRDFDTSSGLFNKMREAGIYDSRGAAGEFADARHEKLMASFAELEAAGLADMKLDDPRILSLPPDQLHQLAMFEHDLAMSETWAKAGNANTRAMVDGVVTVVTTTVTIIATAAITIVTAGTATPFLVAALMAAGGAAMAGLAGMGVKAVLLGGAYGGNEAKMDLANLVIDSLVAGITAGQGISNFAGKIVGKLGISQKLAQEVLSELIQNAIQAGADLTKFLMDESLYQGSPEEVLAKIRKKSLQVGAGAVLSTGAGVTKYNGAFLQTTIQSAVSYDPSQPAWGQFLNYANSMASAVGTEMATKAATKHSQNKWGEGGMWGPNKGADGGGADADGGGGASPGGMSGGTQEANLPANGMRTRSDGTIEVTSPDIANSLAQQAKSGDGVTIVDGSPPRYRIETPNGPMEAVVTNGDSKPAPQVDVATAKPKTEDAPVETAPVQRPKTEDAPVETQPVKANTDEAPLDVSRLAANEKPAEVPTLKAPVEDGALPKDSLLPKLASEEPAAALPKPKTEDEAAALAKPKTEDEAAALAKPKTEDEAAATKPKADEDPLAAKPKTDEEAAAKKLADDEAAAKKKADDDAAAKKLAADELKVDDQTPAKADALPNNQIQDEKGQIVPNRGLADASTMEPYLHSMKDLQRNWDSLTEAQRVKAVELAVNKALADHGIPETKVAAAAISGDGELDPKGGTILINKAHFADAATPEQIVARVRQLVDTAYHEARHAEQWHLTVKHLQDSGWSAEQIHKGTGINPDIIAASMAHPVALSPGQMADGKKYYEGIFKYDPNDPTKGLLARNDVIERRNAGETGAYAEYKNLAEERDAWAVGSKAAEQFDKVQSGKTGEMPAVQSGDTQQMPRKKSTTQPMPIWDDLKSPVPAHIANENGPNAAPQAAAASSTKKNAAEADAPIVKPKDGQELAKEAQQLANEERANSISPEQRAKFDKIDRLALSMETQADMERLRALEAQIGRPVSERLSPIFEEAKLQAEQRRKNNFGTNEDGSQRTQEQHLASLKQRELEVQAIVKKAKDEHAAKIEADLKQTNEQIAAKDNAVTEQVLGGATPIAGDAQKRKEVTVDARASLGMGGAGAAGAKGDLPGDYDGSGPRKDRIGFVDSDKPELWETLGHKPMGQEAKAISYGTGGARTEDHAMHPTAQVANASDMALQVAKQRNESGVGSIGSDGPVGELEYRPVKDSSGKVTHYEVGIPVTKKTDAGAETTIVWMKQGADISTGMGQARELVTQKDGPRPQQITEEHANQLKQDKDGKGPALLSGEAALAADAKSFEGQRVLGIGGGPTSEWAMEHAMSGGAKSAEVAGQLPKPDARSKNPAEAKLATDLAKVDAEIRQAVDQAMKDGKRVAVPEELTNRYREIITEHVNNMRNEMAEIKRSLETGKENGSAIDAGKRERLQQRFDKLKGDIDPFLGSRVDRNFGTLNRDDITHVQGDVIRVRPDPDGDGIEVTYSDGRTVRVDRIIPSIGADPDAPGGINKVLRNAPPEMELIPVISGGRVVGLESNPPGISISGAAMTGTLGFNLPPEILKRIPADMRDAVVASIIDHANRKDVSDGSRGIIPGIENVGANTELTVRALSEIPPDERSAAVKKFLEDHKARRTMEGLDGQLRFPDLQPRSGDKDARLARLGELQQELKSPNEEVRKKAESEVKRLQKDPEWVDAFRQKSVDSEQLAAINAEIDGIDKTPGQPYDQEKAHQLIGAAVELEHKLDLMAAEADIKRKQEQLDKANLSPEDRAKAEKSLAAAEAKREHLTEVMRTKSEGRQARHDRERVKNLEIHAAKLELDAAKARKDTLAIERAEARLAKAQQSSQVTSHAEAKLRLLENKGLRTVDAFCTVDLPSDYSKAREILENPNNWTPERQAFHRDALERAKKDALAMAAAIKQSRGEDGDDGSTMFLMRGNTAAGKSRSISGGSGPEDLAAGVKATGKGGESSDDGKERRHRAINPDNFKKEIYENDPQLGINSTQAHEESSIMSEWLHRELLNTKDESGAPIDMVVDKRLAWQPEVERLIKEGVATGRKVHMIDVDADLTTSFAGVLDRDGKSDPVPPSGPITGGFIDIRANRLETIRLLANEPTASYQLFGTNKAGEKVLIAEIKPLKDGEKMPANPMDRLQLVKSQAEFEAIAPIVNNKADKDVIEHQAKQVPDQTITPELIESMTKDVAQPYGDKLRASLERHKGKTWREALDFWSQNASSVTDAEQAKKDEKKK